MMVPSDIGCKCFEVYFKGHLGNCIKCNKGCPTCTDILSYLKCSALNSHDDQNSGCVCDEGFYKLKKI